MIISEKKYLLLTNLIPKLFSLNIMFLSKGLIFTDKVSNINKGVSFVKKKNKGVSLKLIKLII
jgi:hypothetical protein